MQREERAGDAKDLLAVWRLERVGHRPEQAEHRVLHDGGDADGGDQRQQLAALAPQRREDRDVDRPAEHRADHERGADARQVAAAQHVHEEIGGERAERDEIRMREVDLDQHAVDQREAESHQHIQATENDAVDRLLRDDRRRHALSSTSAHSRRGPAWSPCNGSCPSWCSGCSCRTRRCR